LRALPLIIGLTAVALQSRNFVGDLYTTHCTRWNLSWWLGHVGCSNLVWRCWCTRWGSCDLLVIRRGISFIWLLACCLLLGFTMIIVT